MKDNRTLPPRKHRYLMLRCMVLALCLASVVQGSASADPSASCSSLAISLSTDKNYYILTATAAGDSSTITGYTFDFGDHQSYTVSFGADDKDRETASVTHTYQNAGRYTPTAWVNTKAKTTSSSGCKTTLTISPPSASLPNAGATGVPELFVGTILGVIAASEIRFRCRRAMLQK